MQTTQGTPIEVGTTVYTSDGSKIGDVAEVQQNYFVIEKGFIFTEDLYIPTSALSGSDSDGLRLSLTKDEIDSKDWSSVPVLSDQNAAGPVGYAGQHTDAPSAYATGGTGMGTDTGTAYADPDAAGRREGLDVDDETTRP